MIDRDEGDDLGCWQLISIIRGLFILLSLLFGLSASPLFVSAQWLWVCLLIAVNMLTSGLTGFCLLSHLFCKLGAKRA
ncbi:YgaP family membrane protein [Testudinibacter sp. TR-2022]